MPESHPNICLQNNVEIMSQMTIGHDSGTDQFLLSTPQVVA